MNSESKSRSWSTGNVIVALLAIGLPLLAFYPVAGLTLFLSGRAQPSQCVPGTGLMLNSCPTQFTQLEVVAWILGEGVWLLYLAGWGALAVWKWRAIGTALGIAVALFIVTFGLIYVNETTIKSESMWASTATYRPFEVLLMGIGLVAVHWKKRGDAARMWISASLAIGVWLVLVGLVASNIPVDPESLLRSGVLYAGIGICAFTLPILAVLTRVLPSSASTPAPGSPP